MPRAYSTSAVAHALGAPPKWLDNLLSQNHVDGVLGGRQGVPRQLSPESVATLFVTTSLAERMGCTTQAALKLARSLITNGNTQIAPGVWLMIEPDVVSQRIGQLLLDAVQAAPPKRRGRPPTRRDPAAADSD